METSAKLQSTILQIDTSKKDTIILGLFDQDLNQSFEYDSPKQSENLLLMIDQLLKASDKTLGDLKATIVNIGPGSYTGLRIGVTVANVLAWSLNIGVYGYKEKDLLKTIALAKKSQKKFSTVVLPSYE